MFPGSSPTLSPQSGVEEERALQERGNALNRWMYYINTTRTIGVDSLVAVNEWRKIKGKESFFLTPNGVLQRHGLGPVKLTVMVVPKELATNIHVQLGRFCPPTLNLLENQQPALNFLILQLPHKG